MNLAIGSVGLARPQIVADVARSHDRAILNHEQRPFLNAFQPRCKDVTRDPEDRSDPLALILRTRSRKGPKPSVLIDLLGAHPGNLAAARAGQKLKLQYVRRLKREGV